MATTSGCTRWVLEIVRGRDIGRRYPVAAGETTIGNALAGAAGFDLTDQEANSPRRMAGRHACLVVKNEGLFVQDLESPGGTFVNRQRLLSAQPRPLQPGDMIQLGGVQLVVKREDVPEPRKTTPPPPIPAPHASPQVKAKSEGLAIPFTITGGSTCRTWDDFLSLAAQRWTVVRDELTSGRIAGHLKRIGRTDLLPRPDPNLSADEQLDAWLAQLPVSRASGPELDVHPQPLRVKTAAGGGMVRTSLRITNVGYRLLRSTVRIEPAAGQTIQVADEFTARPFLTIDHTDVAMEIQLPEKSRAAVLGAVVVEGNGGTRRIEVLLERPVAPVEIVPGSNAPRTLDLAINTRPLGELIAAQPPARRLVAWPLALMVFRLLVFLVGLMIPGSSESHSLEPRLGSIAVVLAVAGALFGFVRAGGNRDRPACGFAGAMAGLLAAATGFALVRSVESLLGSWAGFPPAVLLFWGLLGGVIALVSLLALPPVRPVATPPLEPMA